MKIFPSLVTFLLASVSAFDTLADVPWPPDLPGAKQGTVSLTSTRFLAVPPEVAATAGDEGVAPFVMAKAPPNVDLALHRNLGSDAVNRRLWSSWGDICVASDGRVYVGIGDHGNDAGGDARCFIYRWDPATKLLEQIIDMNKVVPERDGQPAWSKVHAKIDEGNDGRIYFSCTLNAGSRAGQPQFKWNDQLPGGQLYAYDPKTEKTTVVANLPPKRCSATSLFDARRNVWWCNLEAGNGDALYAIDLKTGKLVFRGSDGDVGFNRNFALANDGSIYFNGQDGQVMQVKSGAKKATKTGAVFPDSPGMRASTRQTSQGDIFGATHRTNQLFRFRPSESKIELLGPTWGTGQYTTVAVLSPNEKFVYYLPGSHGKAYTYGTPVVQYEIATKKRKVLAFLAPAFGDKFNYVPGGSYGVKLSQDGATLYVNFNGHAADKIRPDHMRANGFGLCSFAAIHIPKSERD